MSVTRTELNNYFLHLLVWTVPAVALICAISGIWLILPLAAAYIGANRLVFGWLVLGDPNALPRRMFRKFGVQGLILLGLAAAIPSTLICMWMVAR